jgi:hypothetical protein
MTSTEIQQKPAADLSTNSWLREIALQLALANEKPVKSQSEASETPVVKAAAPERVKRAYNRKAPK